MHTAAPIGSTEQMEVNGGGGWNGRKPCAADALQQKIPLHVHREPTYPTANQTRSFANRPLAKVTGPLKLAKAAMKQRLPVVKHKANLEGAKRIMGRKTMTASAIRAIATLNRITKAWMRWHLRVEGAPQSEAVHRRQHTDARG